MVLINELFINNLKRHKSFENVKVNLVRLILETRKYRNFLVESDTQVDLLREHYSELYKNPESSGKHVKGFKEMLLEIEKNASILVQSNKNNNVIKGIKKVDKAEKVKKEEKDVNNKEEELINIADEEEETQEINDIQETQEINNIQENQETEKLDEKENKEVKELDKPLNLKENN